MLHHYFFMWKQPDNCWCEQHPCDAKENSSKNSTYHTCQCGRFTCSPLWKCGSGKNTTGNSCYKKACHPCQSPVACGPDLYFIDIAKKNLIGIISPHQNNSAAICHWFQNAFDFKIHTVHYYFPFFAGDLMLGFQRINCNCKKKDQCYSFHKLNFC